MTLPEIIIGDWLNAPPSRLDMILCFIGLIASRLLSERGDRK